MVNLLLRPFDLLRPLLSLLGVDYEQFRAIMQVKLTLDGRRRSVGMHGASHKQDRNTQAWTLFFHAFMGIFVGAFVAHADSPLVGMTVVHAFVMTMVGMSLIADFSTVLLDTTDNAILHPRPVTSRTLLVARIAHITTYLGLLAVSTSACTFVVGTYTYHYLFPLVFLWTLVCSVLLVVFAAQVFYLIAMRLTDAEKFRDIILYFQIAMTVVIFGGYQLMPRLMDMRRLRELAIDDRWWIYFFPPTWMSAPVDLLTGHVGRPQLVLTALSIVVPLCCLLLVVRVLAPRFARSLAALENAPSGKAPGAATTPRQRLPERLARIVSRSPCERAAFEWIWRLASRDRQFKLRTYPTVAFLLLMGLVIVMSDEGGFRQAFAVLPESNKHLLLLYMGCAMAPMAVIALRYSAAHEAAWVYYALPLGRPGDVLAGALKVVLARLVMPTFSLIALVTLAIWGGRILLDVLLAFFATLMVSGIQAMLFARRFPFSEEYQVAEGSGRAARSMLLMIFPAALGGMHWALLLFVPAVIPLAIPLWAVLMVIAFRAYACTSWQQVRGTR